MNEEPEELRQYDLAVDRNMRDRATEVKPCSVTRPHMRSFHVNWLGFFVCFFAWFAFAPLMTEVKEELGLTDGEVYNSIICSVFGTVIVRWLIGPLNDKYGPRQTYLYLIFCSLPFLLLCGFVQNAWQLCLLRFFVGALGGSFVSCQYWNYLMFSTNIIGVTGATVAGLGNMGGGVTQVITPLFRDLLKALGVGDSGAWRLSVSLLPILVLLAYAALIHFFTDDTPRGNYKELKASGAVPDKDAWDQLKKASCEVSTWILTFQYSLAFGIELTILNIAPLYYEEDMGMTAEAAAAYTFIFSSLNLFARPFGGWFSDYLARTNGVQGRLYCQLMFTSCEGILMIIFSRMNNPTVSLVTLCILSLFVQGCEGSTFALVPIVYPDATGSVSGIVGSGGNLGAVLSGILFKILGKERALSFFILGFCITFASLFTFVTKIRNEDTFWTKKDEKQKNDPNTDSTTEQIQLQTQTDI